MTNLLLSPTKKLFSDWRQNRLLVLDLQPQAPEGRPWFWTITAPDIPPSLDKRGYSVTREEAMAEFKARWLS